MSIEERALHELHTGLEEVLGPDRAATLMSHLSPVPSSDVVTTGYLDQRFALMDARIDARFAQVDARFEQVDARFDQVDARFEQLEENLRLVIRAEVATSQAALSQQMNSQTRAMIFALISTLVMMTSLVLAVG